MKHNFIRFKIIVLSCLLTGMMAIPAMAEPPVYTFKNIGTLGGGSSRGRSINNMGYAVGGSTTKTGESHAFLWTPDAGMKDLGTLGGVRSWAWCINDRGQIVGESTTAKGELHAFLWEKDKGMQDLGTLGGIESVAYGINNWGQVVGGANKKGGLSRGFIWDRECGMVDLGGLSSFGGSEARAINDFGQIVGAAKVPNVSAWRAVLWNGKNHVIQDLGAISGIRSWAWNINNSGQVTGFSDATPSGSEKYIFLWDKDNGMQNLGTLPGKGWSWGIGINNSGWINGWICLYQADRMPYNAYIYKDKQLYDVNALIVGGTDGWDLQSSRDINDSGQIIGSGLRKGVWQAFILTPQINHSCQQ